MPSQTDWRNQLEAERRSASAEVRGVTRITEMWHGHLVTTALLACGNEPKATFLVEVLSSAWNIPRPDLILVHPAIGVLVIENKGIGTGDIHHVQDTLLTVVRNGQLRKKTRFNRLRR